MLAKANTAGVAQLAYAPVGGMVTDMTQVTNAERLVSGKHGGQVSVLTDQGQLMVSSGAFAKHEQLIEQKSQAVFEALEAMNLARADACGADRYRGPCSAPQGIDALRRKA